MKTPEELAAQYAILPEAQHMLEAPRSNSVLYHSFLAGYEAAKEHAHAALEEAEAEIDRLQTKLSKAGILTTEHLIDASKMVDVSSSATLNNWISVKDRLPEEDVEVLFFSPKTEFNCFFVGYRPKKDAYVDPEGNGLMPRIIEKYYTHWMPLPKSPEE